MGNRIRIELRWKLLRCDRCGGERVAARSCPDCGSRPAPHEIQPDLDRRRRLVQEFRAARVEALPDEFPWERLGNRFGAAFRSVSRALADAAKRSRDPQAMVRGFEPLDQLVADASVPLLRPQRNFGRRVYESLLDVSAGLDHFVAALEASDLHAARECEQAGQALIDSGAARVAGSSRHIRLSESLATGDYMQTLAMDHTGDGATRDLDEIGRELAARLGLGAQTDLGVSIVADVLDVMAEACLDRLRYDELAEVASTQLGQQTEVLGDESARRDMVDDMLRMNAKASRLLQAIEDDETELTIVGEALGLLLVLRERCLRHSLAVLLATDKESAYGSMRQQRSGELMKRADRAFPELRLSDLDRNLRNAGAHEDFEVQDGLLLLDGGKVTMDPDDFVDGVLQFLEVYVGIQRGVLVAMAQHGKPYPTSADLSRNDRLGICEYMLVTTGLTGVRLTQDSDNLTIEATGRCRNWSTTVAALTAVLPAEIATVALRSDANGSIVSASAELQPYRDFQSQDDSVDKDSRQMALMGAIAATREEGRCPWDADMWTGIATAVSASRGIDDFLADRVRRVLAVRSLARRAGLNPRGIDLVLSVLRSDGLEANG